jgi:hypothetical protein
MPRLSTYKDAALRLAVPAVLVAVAGCFAYFVTPPPPVETDQRLPPAREMSEVDLGTPANIDQRQSAEDRADAFRRAAEAILKQLPNARASADEPPILGTSRCQRGARSRVHDTRSAAGAWFRTRYKSGS